MAREALLVTFDERVDPQLARIALEELLRKGVLRWVGLDGNNVQVWRTADITQALDSQPRGTERRTRGRGASYWSGEGRAQSQSGG